MKRRTFSSEGCADAMVAAAYEDEAEGDPLGNAVASMKVEIEQLKMVAWAAYRELNEIRARDGVPYTHQGGKACVDEAYFSAVVDALHHVLGDDAKPWPATRWLNQDGSFQFPGQNAASF